MVTQVEIQLLAELSKVQKRAGDLGVSTNTKILPGASREAQLQDTINQINNAINEFLSKPSISEIIIQEEPILDVPIQERITEPIGVFETPDTSKENNTLRNALIIGGVALLIL